MLTVILNLMLDYLKLLQMDWCYIIHSSCNWGGATLLTVIFFGAILFTIISIGLVLQLYPSGGATIISIWLVLQLFPLDLIYNS